MTKAIFFSLVYLFYVLLISCKCSTQHLLGVIHSRRKVIVFHYSTIQYEWSIPFSLQIFRIFTQWILVLFRKIKWILIAVMSYKIVFTEKNKKVSNDSLRFSLKCFFSSITRIHSRFSRNFTTSVSPYISLNPILF